MSQTEKKGPRLSDIAALIQAGIDPKTGLPIVIKPSTPIDKELVFNTRRLFRIIDEQRAVNKYKWYGLPPGISSQELERLLYFKYSLCFFYFKELDQFFFMPYALDGTIDFYGRYNTIHPVPMTSGAEKEDQTKEYKQKAALLSTKKLNVVKDVILYKEDITKELLENSAVILRDYTNQMGQLGEPRYLLNDSLIEMEATCLCFLRTNLLIGSGIQAMRVPDADSAVQVKSITNQMYESALSGNPYIAVIGKTQFQELQPSTLTKSSEYFLAMQSVDNILLSTHGIDNSGVYEKKAHILESENQVNFAVAAYVKMDGLESRRHFADIANSIWGTSIWVEEGEVALAMEEAPMFDEEESSEEQPQKEDQANKGGEE